jgi:hypothetical protein
VPFNTPSQELGSLVRLNLSPSSYVIDKEMQTGQPAVTKSGSTNWQVISIGEISGWYGRRHGGRSGGGDWMREKLLVFAVGSILTLPALASAQGAYTIPRSDRVILGELTLPGGVTARFTVRDGTWVTAEYPKHYFFGFLGQINDSTDQPNFIPFELRRDKTDYDRITVNELDKTGFNLRDRQDPARDIAIGQKVTFSSARGCKLRVTGRGEAVFETPYISDASQYSEEDLEKQFGYSASTNCCITCQGATLCASGVDTSCGSCGGGGHGWVN